VSNFKSPERVARGRFKIKSTITPELYYTKSSYQLSLFITICEIRKIYVPVGEIFLLISLQAVEKQL